MASDDFEFPLLETEQDMEEKTAVVEQKTSFMTADMMAKQAGLVSRSRTLLTDLRMLQTAGSAGLHARKQVRDLTEEHKLGRLPQGVAMPTAPEMLQTVRGDRQLVRRLESLRKCLTRESAQTETINEFLVRHGLTMSSRKTGMLPLHELAKRVRQFDAKKLNEDYIYKEIWPLFPIDSAVEFWTNLNEVTSTLKNHVDACAANLDPYATEESSGGDSGDEFLKLKEPDLDYPGATKRRKKDKPHKSISLHPYSTWGAERGWLASRYSWLTAQLGDIDIKARQATQIHRYLRQIKKKVLLLPPKFEPDEDESETCARVRPLDIEKFEKRQIIRIAGLHASHKRSKDKSVFSKPPRIPCACAPPLDPCILCTGRLDRGPPQPDPVNERLVTRFCGKRPSYHPHLTHKDDILLDEKLEQSLASHLLAPQRKRRIRLNAPRKKPAVTAFVRRVALGGGLGVSLTHSVPALRSRDKNAAEGEKRGSAGNLEELASPKRSGDSKVPDTPGATPSSKMTPGPVSQRRPTSQSLGTGGASSTYGIDDIVIDPAATVTRVEQLPRYEITTRSFRTVDESEDPDAPQDLADVDECLDDLIYATRHDAAEREERARSASYRAYVTSWSRGHPSPSGISPGSEGAWKFEPYAPRDFDG